MCFSEMNTVCVRGRCFVASVGIKASILLSNAMGAAVLFSVCVGFLEVLASCIIHKPCLWDTACVR